MFLGFVNHGAPSRSKSSGIKAVIAMSIVSTLFVMYLVLDSFFLKSPRTLALISPLQNQDVQNCVMSYSYPTFHEFDAVNSSLSQKYHLYLYREGNLDNLNHLHGTPILFIPGQAGSYKQVRSLASATTNFAHSHRLTKNMDFFTVDLNEELSALSGQTLLDQAEYINTVIERILSLYRAKPASVVILGHSMGGVIARTMFMLPNYVPNSVNTIITLATPHLTAPLILDPMVMTIYNDMTEYWKSNTEALENVTVISIAGGSLDNIVHSDGVVIDSIIPKTHGFTTFTTAIPGVWVGADHMAILWCNQLIQLLAEMLHGYLNLGLNPTVDQRMELFRFYLLEGRDASLIKNQDLYQKHFSDSPNFIDLDNYPNYNLYMDDSAQQNFIFLSNSTDLQFVTNIDPQFDNCWSFALCTKTPDSDSNFSCDYVKPDVKVIPSASAGNLVGSTPYRVLHVESIKGHLGLVQQCHISMNERPFMQVHKISNQPIIYTDSVWDIFLRGLVIEVDPYHSHHVFKNIRNSLFAFDVHVESLGGNPSARYKPMLEQRINNKVIKYYRGLVETESNRITFHQENDGEGLSLVFFTDGQQLKVRIKFDWYGTLGRSVLRYGTIVANFFWISTAVVLLTQIYTYAANGRREFVAYPVAYKGCLKSAYLQLVIILFGVGVVQHIALKNSFMYAFFSRYTLFGSDEWLLIALPLLALGISVGLTAITWLLVKLLVTIIGISLKAVIKSGVPRSGVRNNAMSRFVIYSACTLGLVRVVPSAVLFAFYFVVWFFLTCSAYTKSDLPTSQNVYQYRQSVLIFLISFLPYYVPQLIVFTSDVLVGWYPSYSINQDVFVVFCLIYLIAFARTPEIINMKSALMFVFVMNALVLYQLIFGFFNPFIYKFIINN